MVKFNSKNSEITFEFELVEQNLTVIIQNFNKENYDFAMIHASIMSRKKKKIFGLNIFMTVIYNCSG